ncbi:MAG: hypothetical protein V4449_03410 [Patescibacteria group bacterium]
MTERYRQEFQKTPSEKVRAFAERRMDDSLVAWIKGRTLDSFLHLLVGKGALFLAEKLPEFEAPRARIEPLFPRKAE